MPCTWHCLFGWLDVFIISCIFSCKWMRVLVVCSLLHCWILQLLLSLIQSSWLQRLLAVYKIRHIESPLLCSFPVFHFLDSFIPLFSLLSETAQSWLRSEASVHHRLPKSLSTSFLLVRLKFIIIFCAIDSGYAVFYLSLCLIGLSMSKEHPRVTCWTWIRELVKIVCAY